MVKQCYETKQTSVQWLEKNFGAINETCNRKNINEQNNVNLFIAQKIIFFCCMFHYLHQSLFLTIFAQKFALFHSTAPQYTTFSISMKFKLLNKLMCVSARKNLCYYMLYILVNLYFSVQIY